MDDSANTDPLANTRSSKASLPTPFMLASCVAPGLSVHESREHGFRLTVHDGSLPCPIGPITVEDIALVIKCENESDSYLTTTVVNCRPAGIQFPEKPLFMDFRVDDTSNDISEAPDGDISKTFQVLVREGGAGGWRKIDSKMCADQWGAYMRADIQGFSTFGFGEKVNPASPFHTRPCKKKGMIGVANATHVKAFFVLVPVSFDTERTVRASYTGSLTGGIAGATFEAAGGTEHESSTVSILLPAGLSPSYIQVLPEGSFEFATPTGASQGMLLVATLSPQPQAAPSSQPPVQWQTQASSVQIVNYYGKFETPKGETRVLLSGCLECGHLAEGIVSLNRGDSLVNMVMVMAGMAVSGASVAS